MHCIKTISIRITGMRSAETFAVFFIQDIPEHIETETRANKQVVASLAIDLFEDPQLVVPNRKRTITVLRGKGIQRNTLALKTTTNLSCSHAGIHTAHICDLPGALKIQI